MVRGLTGGAWSTKYLPWALSDWYKRSYTTCPGRKLGWDSIATRASCSVYTAWASWAAAGGVRGRGASSTLACLPAIVIGGMLASCWVSARCWGGVSACRALVHCASAAISTAGCSIGSARCRSLAPGLGCKYARLGLCLRSLGQSGQRRPSAPGWCGPVPGQPGYHLGW